MESKIKMESKILIERHQDDETKENESFKKYIFKNLNFSIINGLRRTIISDIPVWCFNGLPNLLKDNKKDETVKIIKNTTRLNNEIIKQRLSCIPVHLDSKKDYSNLVFSLNVSGKDNLDVKYITTKDFEIYENTDNKDKKNITPEFNPLPPNKLTKDHILLIRLNPKISNQIPGEELNLTCRLTKHTAKENGCFNSVSCCSYSYLQDTDKQEKKWNEYAEENRMKWEEKENEDEKKNWYLLNAKRYYHKNQFKFIIETIGVKSCDDLLIEACNILILKFENFQHNIYNTTNDNYKFILDTSIVSLKYAYDITLMNEDYTIGKVIEWIIHKNMEKFKVSYVGFIKTHPHNNSSIVRLVLDESTLNDAQKKSKIKHKEIIKEIISNAYTECINVFKEIKDGIIFTK